MKDQKRGRPSLAEDDTTTSVNVRVPTRDFDRACERARREEAETGAKVSVSAIVRRGLMRELEAEDDE